MERKRCLFIILIFSLAFVYGQEPSLRMALFQLEPFMVQDPITGELGGASVDYWVDYIAPAMGYRVEVLGLFPVNRVMVMLEKGEIDIAPLFTRIPEREELFLFPKTHYDEVESCLMVKNESSIKEIHRQEELFDKRFGFLEGAYLPPIMSHPRIEIELVANTDYRQMNYNKLMAGRIDAWLDINMVSLRYYLQAKGYLSKVRIIELPAEKAKIYSVFRKTPEGEKLSAEYDRINEEGMENGVFEKILASYFN